MPTRTLALFVSLLALAGCATAHGVTRVGTVDVHTFRRDWANAHLVVSGDRLLLVDSGLAANAEALERDIVDAGFDPSRLSAIVLTHGHADHAGGARHFQRRFGTRIVAGSGDREMLASGHNEALCPTSDDARGRLAEDQAATFEPTVADVWIDAPTSLAELTGIEGRIVPLEGHTHGSLVVTLEGAVIVGDLLRGEVFGSGAERHFYMCDLPDNDRDVHALLTELAPTAQSFFVGHFGPLTREAVRARFDD